MLACARIGAIHSVVFGGFSAESLRDRINDSQCRLLITADGGYRRGQVVPLKQIADEAVAETPSIEHVIVVQRSATASIPVTMKPERDHWYHELMKDAPLQCEPEPMDAEDMLYILYTSGTTGKPKGIVHTTGGYLVGTYATTKLVFDLRDEDVYWCTADIGWVTGHSYVVYGPLANGATVLMYEGAPDWPQKDRFWSMIEQYGVTIFYTAPTAIRAFMRWGTEWPKKHDLSSLRLIGSVGEPINPEAWIWYYKFIGGERCPVVDTWWQTETGAIMITPLPGVTTLKPGSATKPFPGISAEIRTEQRRQGGGRRRAARADAAVAVDAARHLRRSRSLRPPVLEQVGQRRLRHRRRREARRRRLLLAARPRRRRDQRRRPSASGRWRSRARWSITRAVAEAAVVGRAHEIKGQAIAAFVTLKEGAGERLGSKELIDDLKEHVVKKIGAIARPDDILFTADLPKTRSGKIMRRLLRDIAEGKALGDTTTLADPAVVAKLKANYEEETGG